MLHLPVRAGEGGLAVPEPVLPGALPRGAREAGQRGGARLGAILVAELLPGKKTFL